MIKSNYAILKKFLFVAHSVLCLFILQFIIISNLNLLCPANEVHLTVVKIFYPDICSLKALTSPLLILHAEDDNVVPYHMGLKVQPAPFKY